MNTTNAIIMKFNSAPQNAPNPNTIGPKRKVAVCHDPPGMNGVMIGIIILFTRDVNYRCDSNTHDECDSKSDHFVFV